ncbi:MAG: transcription antitermination factor NusB [Pseudomonadota bacterium]
MKRRQKRDNPHAARSRARKRAVQALYQWEITRQDAGDILRQFTEEQDMGRVDVEYFEALVNGTVAAVEALDAVIAGFLDRELDRLDVMEKSLLRLGAFELRDRIEVPFKVVINEAVSLADTFGTEQSPTYVNAVLDRCSGEWRAVEYAAAK